MPPLALFGLLAVVVWLAVVCFVVAWFRGATGSPSPSAPCVSSRRRSLIGRLRRRRIGTPSLDARLAGYGTGGRGIVRERVPSMRAASALLPVRGDYGQALSGCFVSIPTPTLRPSPSRFGSLSTGGFAADTGDASTGGKWSGRPGETRQLLGEYCRCGAHVIGTPCYADFGDAA